MVLSASAYTSLQYYGSVWTIFERQVLWMGLGGIAFVRHGPHALRPVAAAAGRAACCGTLRSARGRARARDRGRRPGGSSRWIGVGLLRIQPSELMKLALAVFAADLLARRADRVWTNRWRWWCPLLGRARPCRACSCSSSPTWGRPWCWPASPSHRSTPGASRCGPVLKALGVTPCSGLVVGLAEPYRRARLLSFLDPFAHAKGSGYQVVQSLVGLGSGHLFGLGLGGGREKWGLLPNAHTDFIFSVIGEEVGLVGTLVVLGLFGALAWYGLRAAGRAPDRFGALLAVAATCWITSQAVINIGAVIGLLPVTGIPLPFISFGGSSLVITMVAAGILVNVAAHETAAGSGRAQCGRMARAGACPRPATRRVAATAVSTRRFALVAGGGTGGHLVPALAVARALAEGTGPGASRWWARGGDSRPSCWPGPGCR